MPTDVEKTVLKLGEWLAENAYIAPGKHRFLTALGLMVGLTGGRQLMNVLTAHDGKGNRIDEESLLPPLRRYYGIMEYNRFEDDATAKWHKVADAFVPFILGGLGAMAGSAYFARGTPITKGLTAALGKGAEEGYFLQHADMLANKQQAYRLNYLSGVGLNIGSTGGVHLFPTMMASSTSAFRFQIDHGKNIILPGLKQLTKNRGHSSRNMYMAMSDFISWAENNAAHYTGTQWYKNETQPIIRYAKDMMQVFKEATPEQRKLVEDRVEALCVSLDKMATEIAAEEKLHGEKLVGKLKKDEKFQGSMKEFLTKGLEDAFIDAKLLDPKKPDLSNIAAGDYGPVSTATYLLGGRKASQGYVENWQRAMQKRHGVKAAEPVAPAKSLVDDTPPYLTAFAGVAGLLGITSLFSKGHDKGIYPASPEVHPDRSLPRHEQARIWHKEHDADKGKGLVDAINGKPLDLLSWASSLTVVPPGLHRFMNAAFLTGFLYTGAKFSSALAARDLRGVALSAEEIWPMFKPLHGKMSYVWKSGERADRWKHVAHQLIPVTVGAAGTYTGSRVYFEETYERARQSEYLEDYTDRILLEESESYARASAVTSILNTGSGFHLLPFVSYPANLQNRFLFARGQQIATPGIGAWWSGNPSKYPFHVRRLLSEVVNYAVHNSAEFPQEFDPMMHALVAKLYPDLPEKEINEKRDMLVDKLYEIRDRYWQEGGVPALQKKFCREELEQHFRREGLEKTLREVGLDPMQAALDNNGAGGAFARWMGAGNTVNSTINEYHAKLAKRAKPAEPGPQEPAHEAPDTQIGDRIAMGTQQPGLSLVH